MFKVFTALAFKKLRVNIMKKYADIVVFDKFGQIALLVEVKNKREKSEDWAIQLHRNIYAHDDMPMMPYFLLAMPDKFYLWKNAASEKPDFTISPQVFLQQFYITTGIPENHSEIGFSFVISFWLNKITTGELSEKTIDSKYKWLITSGFLEKLNGGHITSEAA